MKGAYLLALVVSLLGLGLVDYRFKLAFFYNKTAALTVLAIMIPLFIAWDIAGISLNIFFIGASNYLLGVRIGEFPIEELFFLLLLNYSTLVVYTFVKNHVVEVRR